MSDNKIYLGGGSYGIAGKLTDITKCARECPSAAGCSNAYSGFDAVSVDGDPMSVRALKQAYRKHVQGDETIGWDELSDTLGNALAQIMGDEEFCEWVKSN